MVLFSLSFPFTILLNSQTNQLYSWRDSLSLHNLAYIANTEAFSAFSSSFLASFSLFFCLPFSATYCPFSSQSSIWQIWMTPRVKGILAFISDITICSVVAVVVIAKVVYQNSKDLYTKILVQIVPNLVPSRFLAKFKGHVLMIHSFHWCFHGRWYEPQCKLPIVQLWFLNCSMPLQLQRKTFLCMEISLHQRDYML